MAKRIEALIQSELLVWARKNAGLTLEEAAKKVLVKPERLASWEAGERRPTINQLRKLAKAYKRPMALFYLPESPRDFQPMHDFRRFPGETAPLESPQLRSEIRRARQRREIALELYEDLEGEAPQFSGEASLSDDPEGLASRIRNVLGITHEDQIMFRDYYDALNSWRSALENAGVLIFQAMGVDLSEMRGFSVSETPFPVIVVNVQDAPVGRIFTMLHEFVHILLRDGGICDLIEEPGRTPEKQRVEVFSNYVAGAILVPKDDLLKEGLVLKKGPRAEWSNEEIAKLAGRYRVSHEVLLRRLLIWDRTTREFYQKKRREFEEEHRAPRERLRGGYPPPYRSAISTAGRLFTRLVLENYYQENITAGDLSDFLNIKLKHMGQIEREIMGYSVEFGAYS